MPSHLQDVPIDHLKAAADVYTELNNRLSSQSDQVPQPMVKPSDIQQDFATTPAIESAQGEQAGAQAVNAALPEANAALQKGQQFMRATKGPSIEEWGQMTPEERQNYLNENQQVERGPAGLTTPNAPQLAPQDLTYTPQNKGQLAQMQTPNVPMPGKTPQIFDPYEQQSRQAAIQRQIKASEANIGMGSTYGEDVAKAEQTEAGKLQQIELQKSSMLGTNVQAMQKIADESKKQADNYAAQMSNELSQMKSVDPSRVWNNTSTLGKVGFVLSAMAGGLQTGGALRNILDSDLRAQEDDIKAHGEKANNFMALVEKYTGERDTAIKAMQAGNEAAINAYTQALQLGVKMTPEHFQLTKENATIDYVRKEQKNNLALQKISQKQQELGQAGGKAQAEIALNTVKVGQAGAKLKDELGQIAPDDKNTYKRVANSIDDLGTITNSMKKGIDPSSLKYQTFMKYALDNGMSSQAIATALSMAGIKDKEKADYMAIGRGFGRIFREEAARISPRIAGNESMMQEWIKTNGPKYIDNPESLNGLIESHKQTIANEAQSMSGKSLRVLQLNKGKSAPYLIKQE